MFVSQESWKLAWDRDVAWGFNFSHDIQALFLYWGTKCKIFYYPWADWGSNIRHQVMLENGTFVDAPKSGICPITKRWETEDEHPNLYRRQVPYRYVLNNDTVQERTATVTVEEREWRLSWLRWTPLFNKVQRCIDVSFDEEVGERTGSWKGGCVGCGYQMLPGEDPIDCLRRMERDRKFN